MKTKEIIGIVVVAGLFVIGTIVSRMFSDTIAAYFDFGFMGIVVYVVAGVVATIIAPISTVPLIPVAAELWGSFPTAVWTLISWIAGDVITFLLARHFGQPLIARFVDIKKVWKYEKAIGDKHLFWQIVFLRIALPVDLLGYVVGLFTSVKATIYTVAVALGAIPLALLASYVSQASLLPQIIAGLIVLILFVIGYKTVRKRIKKATEQQ